METRVDKPRIEAVHEVIRRYIRRTPTVQAAGGDFGLPPCELTLKLEQLQHSGSFKTRGAFANLLGREIPKDGVVAASGGNHGAAVAYAAQRLGVRAKIFVPGVASRAKIERIHACGADLDIVGSRYADARRRARNGLKEPVLCRCTRSINWKQFSVRARWQRNCPRRSPISTRC